MINSLPQAVSVLKLIDFLIFAGALAISLFDTATLLWLGLTVVLTGDRRKPATIAGSAGLLLGSIFFAGHTLIIAHTYDLNSFSVNIAWRVMWVIAVAAPYFWSLAIFYYSGDPAAGRWVRRILTATGFALIILLFVISPLPSLGELIFAPALAPVIAWAYVPYLILCFTLPLIALRRPGVKRAPDRLTVPRDPFRRARPWLIGAASMLALAAAAFAYTAYAIVPQAIPIYNLTADVNRQLYIADGVIAGFIGLAIILLGRAVLSNNVLTERPQSSQGFFGRWRSVVVVSIFGSLLVSFLYNAPIRPIYSLLLTTVLAVIAYALFNWQQYLEHEAFMKRLRPFVTSLHLQDHLVSASNAEGRAESRELFTALCRDALGAERACLLFDRPATAIESADQRSDRFDYFWLPEHDRLLSNAPLKSGEWTRLDADHWVWPLADSRGPIGRLVLGPKINGSEYTAQELQVAATCAERILDALAGEQIARVAMNLLRQRIAQVQVMSAQHKRMLHDDVLPQIHLALLKVEALRNGSVDDREAQISEASTALTQTHRRLSSLVREMSNAVPTRLESEGLAAALKSAIDHDFRDSFDQIEWQASPAAIERARQLPFFASEVIFYAAQEALRNAARHGRGGDADRKLNLSVAIECDPNLRIIIGDDGVGVAAQRRIEPANGSGSGLLFHSTMLAVIGGALTVNERTGGGTQVVIEAGNG